MNTLQVFENPEFGSIRTVEIGGEPWLVGKDVAVALGYSNPQKAVRDHVDAEDKTVNQAFTVNGTQGTLVNESGVYSLIFSSKLPGAKKFKRWVTSEVLPSIRKTGGYSVPSAGDAPASKKDIADLTAAMMLLTEQVTALAAREGLPPASPLALPGSADAERNVFGPAARKSWMRTANEKLDLLTAKLPHPRSIILSQIYKIMESDFHADLEGAQLKVMEAQNLSDCSVLTAISYDKVLRDGFQKIVDFNLAPENRGW